MEKPLLQRVAPLASTAIISFLAYPSQWLFYYIEPGPLRKGDAYIFNILVASALFCYYRACYTDPGRTPADWQDGVQLNGSAPDAAQLPLQQRWCRKSYVLLAVYLPLHVKNSRIPQYLGPNSGQLALLFIEVVLNSFVLFAQTILLGRTLWSLGLNMTTIEGWEVERHHAMLRRARASGGLLSGPNGKQVRIEHQEFPYDVGIWTNICRGMGSSNPIAWFWPFARSPRIETVLNIEHNCIDDPSKPWPPIDPDRMFRAARQPLPGDDTTLAMDMESFRARQEADLARYEDADGEYVVRRRPFHERAQATLDKEGGVYESDGEEVLLIDDDDEVEPAGVSTSAGGQDADDAGEEGWRNKEGERLADFGVDEVVDFYDGDDVPLAELVKRRKAEKAR
ncbi:Palmitoyltransferase [Friedmanniomyces endolithicus]|uniref:Palmitoyltransferase n=1 Tax=Friedmanniomyces endolithicus TaxID=329885 RepID=A0AAN6HA64_9PEZI|nr:Palmitoyltransferase [Friedmanniomyces endolithicus]